jgi:hypothetical protein
VREKTVCHNECNSGSKTLGRFNNQGQKRRPVF